MFTLLRCLFSSGRSLLYQMLRRLLEIKLVTHRAAWGNIFVDNLHLFTTCGHMCDWSLRVWTKTINSNRAPQGSYGIVSLYIIQKLFRNQNLHQKWRALQHLKTEKGLVLNDDKRTLVQSDNSWVWGFYYCIRKIFILVSASPSSITLQRCYIEALESSVGQCHIVHYTQHTMVVI